MSVIFRHVEEDFYAHHKRDLHPSDRDFPLHVHDSHELGYFIAGSGRLLVEGSSYDLYPGCILLMKAGEAHQLRIDPKLPYERITIEFSPNIFQHIDPQRLLTAAFSERPVGQRNVYTPDQLNTELIHSCMNTMSTQFQTVTNSQKHLALVTCLAPVLLDIHKVFTMEINRQPLQKAATVTLTTKLLDYINTHLCEDFNLDTLAATFFTSKTHLNNQFKQATGYTIWEYTVTKRLIQAREYIRDGMPVGMAAISCGWKDYSSFYRSYKSHFGVSPLADKRTRTAKLSPSYDLHSENAGQ